MVEMTDSQKEKFLNIVQNNIEKDKEQKNTEANLVDFKDEDKEAAEKFLEQLKMK